MKHNNQEEIIRQLSELVNQLRSENTMSSDAGLFQAPPPSGELSECSGTPEETPLHIARVIRLRLRSIKENTPVA